MSARPDLHLVTFRLGDQLYGVDIMQVHRVLAASAPIPAPGAPPHVLGMIDLHGQLVALLDLRCLLGLEGADPGRRVLVAHRGGQLVGLVVDEVEARVRVNAEDVLARPDEVGAGAISGAFRAGEAMGLLLDPDRLGIDGLEELE